MYFFTIFNRYAFRNAEDRHSNPNFNTPYIVDIIIDHGPVQ